MEPVKLGIIGCGIAARELHWPALRQLKDQFQIVCVCNHTEQKAKDFSEMIGGIRYVTNYQQILEDPEIEAVDIILPIHLNFQVTKEALEAGKHVMVEKPLAASLEEAEEMVGFEKRYDRVMMVAENFRYHALFYRMKEYFENGTMGTPYSVFWNNFCTMDLENRFAQTKWRLNHQYPGGFITDGGVHNIAALRYLFGEIDAGIAYARSINPQIGKIDSMSFQFTTSNQVNGIFNSYYSANGYEENRMIVLGTKGTMTVEGNTLMLGRNGQADIKETIESDWGYKGEFEDFYHGIRSGKKVLSTFKEAYQDLKVMVDALESVDKWVHFKF